MTAKQTSRGEPRFTDDELKAIHRELFNVGWQTEAFYTQRKTVIRKLDNYFQEERAHLRLVSR